MLGDRDFALLGESRAGGMHGDGGEGERGGHGGYFDGGKSSEGRREGRGIDENSVVGFVIGLSVEVHRFLRFESEGGVLAEILLHLLFRDGGFDAVIEGKALEFVLEDHVFPIRSRGGRGDRRGGLRRQEMRFSRE